MSDLFAQSPYRFWVFLLLFFGIIYGYYVAVENLIHEEDFFQDFLLAIDTAYNKTPISALSTKLEWIFFILFFIMFLVCAYYTFILLQSLKISGEVLINYKLSMDERQKWETLKDSLGILLGLFLSFTIIFGNFTREILTEAISRKERSLLNMKLETIIKRLDDIQNNENNDKH